MLILVRQRGELFEAIIRALKNEHVEVAGADRLVLTEHIAVMDLMVLADALLLPQDDLALATVLRSPLFGFSDDDLFAIAWDRGRVSLREALARKAGEGEMFAAAAHAQLEELAQAARRETPFAFYAQILGAGGARHHFLGRLGAEANDALDEFLNLALDYERRETPSLQGFMAWLREARAEVKRDMEIARDEVRVMTVHGAKGLEAPIVFLADTMTPPAGPAPPRLLELTDKGADLGRPQGRRSTAGRRRAAAFPARSHRRISAAALRGDDPRRRSADHLRRRRRATPAGRLLVRSDLRTAQAVSGRGDRGRGQSLSLPERLRVRQLNKQNRPRSRHSRISRNLRRFPNGFVSVRRIDPDSAGRSRRLPRSMKSLCRSHSVVRARRHAAKRWSAAALCTG